MRRNLALLLTILGSAIPSSAAAFNFAEVQALIETQSADVLNTVAAIGDPNTDVSGNWTCGAPCTGLGFSATGTGRSGFGVLGSQVTVSVGTAPSSSLFVDARTIAVYTDRLTITGGSGQGVLALSYAVHGSTSITPGGPQGVGSTFAMCDNVGCSDSTIFFSVNGGPLTSEHTTQPGFGGDGTVTFYVPFTYGSALDIEPLFAAEAQFQFGFGSNNTIPFSASVNFNSTVTLGSALVYSGTPTSLGTQNSSAVIGSGDGFTYGPNGLSVATPEPASFTMLSIGLLALWGGLAARAPVCNRRK